MSASSRTSLLVARALRPVCRVLPPIVSYRIFFKLTPILEGAELTFRDTRALFGDARLDASMSDVVDVNFAYQGTAEWSGVLLASLLTHKGDVVFEVGANLGTETVNLADIVGRAGRVVAIEPGAMQSARLEQRVRKNRLDQVVPVRVAVSDEDGTATLHPGSDVNSGMAYLDAGRAAGTGESVALTTLDRLADQHGVPSFVWMDIEGYELKALRGAKRIVSSGRPFIYTEVDRGHLERAGDSLEAFIAFLREHRYHAYDPLTWMVRRVDETRIPPGFYHCNWLLVPDEKAAQLDAIRPSFALARFLPRV